LKTGFSEMGWGSTPLLSANFRILAANLKNFLFGKKQNSILLNISHSTSGEVTSLSSWLDGIVTRMRYQM
jgi:hypothetical protein